MNFDFTKLPDLLIKVIDYFTWPKIGRGVVIIFVSLGAYTAWEQRTPIYKGIVAFNPSKTMIQAPVSEATDKAATELLGKTSKIVAVQLVSVDFRTNSRKTEYFKSTIPAMQRVMDDYARNKIGDTPFFTDDQKNNLRNTSLINGEFTCYNLDDVAIFSRLPLLGSFSKTVCSVSIPPYPGYFSGYVNVYLAEVPSENDKIDIRAAIRKLSLVTFDAEFPK